MCEIINTTFSKYYSAYESILNLKQVSAFLSDDPTSLTHPTVLQHIRHVMSLGLCLL